MLTYQNYSHELEQKFFIIEILTKFIQSLLNQYLLNDIILNVIIIIILIYFSFFDKHHNYDYLNVSSMVRLIVSVVCLITSLIFDVR